MSRVSRSSSQRPKAHPVCFKAQGSVVILSAQNQWWTKYTDQVLE